MFKVEGIKEIADESFLEGEVEEVFEVEDNEDNPNISLHAITGPGTSRTMRVSGSLHNQELVILIDSGSTHNFVDPVVVQKAKLLVDSSHTLAVTVANGDKVKSEGKLYNLKLRLQGHTFAIDAYVLVLGGCDMVFGVH